RCWRHSYYGILPILCQGFFDSIFVNLQKSNFGLCVFKHSCPLSHFPIQNSLKILSSKSSLAVSPVTSPSASYVACRSIDTKSNCCGQSALFTIIIIALLCLDDTSTPTCSWLVPFFPPKPIIRSSSETRRSCSVTCSEPSNTSNITSALSAADRLRCIPICSI